MNVDMDVHSLVAEITSVVERQTEKELDVVDYRGANRNETKELEQRSEEKMSSEDSIVQTMLEQLDAGEETLRGLSTHFLRAVAKYGALPDKHSGRSGEEGKNAEESTKNREHKASDETEAKGAETVKDRDGGESVQTAVGLSINEQLTVFTSRIAKVKAPIKAFESEKENKQLPLLEQGLVLSSGFKKKSGKLGIPQSRLPEVDLLARLSSIDAKRKEMKTKKRLEMVEDVFSDEREAGECGLQELKRKGKPKEMKGKRSAGQETTERCENAGEPKRKGEPKKRKEKPDDHLKRLVQEHDEHTMQEILARIERLKSQGREEETRGQRFKRHLQEYNEKKENQKKTSEKPAEKIPAPEEQVREKIPPPPPAVVRNRLVAPPPPTPRRPPPPSFKDDWHNWFANSVCTSTRNRCPTDGSADDAAPPPPADQQSPPSPVPPPPDRLPAPAAVQTGHSSTDVLQSTIRTLELTANANVLLTTMLWGMQPPIQQSLPIPMLPYIPAPPFVPAPPLHYNPIASHASRPTTQTSEPFRPERSEQSRKEYAKEAKKGRRYRNQKNRDGSP